MIKLLKRPGDKAEVTDYYLKIVLKALGDSYEVVNKTEDISIGDIVITSSILDAKAVFKEFKKGVKVINWYQGIYPEEVAVKDKGFIKEKLGKYLSKYGLSLLKLPLALPLIVLSKAKLHIKYLEFVEKKILNLCYINIFVSEAMRRHFAIKYGYNKNNVFIMPCFNTKFNHNTVEPNEKYNTMNFCYLGSMDVWQCFEDAVLTFKEIEKIHRGAFFKVLTPQVEIARSILQKHAIKNFEVKEVAKSEISKELSQMKYGFILRKNIDVNNVATPTKMGDYLANGLVPIFSDSIIEYYNFFKNNKYFIIHKRDMNMVELAEMIIKFDREVDLSGISGEYEKVFDKYFNEDFYIEKLRQIVLS